MAESRYIKRDKASLQFDMYRSETPVLKLANTTTTAGNDDVLFIYNNVHGFRLWVIYPTHTSGVSSSPTLQGSLVLSGEIETRERFDLLQKALTVKFPGDVG